MGPGFLIGTFAVGMAINLIIWYFISRRRSKIAKWIQVVLYVLGLVFFLTSLNNPLSPKGLALAANLVIYALYGAATYMLFRPDTAAWLGNDRVDPRSEEHTSELQSLMRISYAVSCLQKTTQIH